MTASRQYLQPQTVFSFTWHLIAIAALFLSAFIVNFAQAETVIKVASRGDSNAEYAIGAIKLGLDKINYSYRLDIDNYQGTEDRNEKEVMDGTKDILWAATTQQKEDMFIPVRFPLYKGLIGNRIFIVHRDNKDLFANVKSLADLQRFTLGQGRNWADTEILRANGLKVDVGPYEGLFMMADGKRFDGYPRAVYEPWGEIEKRPGLNLTVDEHVLLVYKMPYYLFVTPKRPELAEAIYKGLMATLEDGSFDNYFYNNPFIKKSLVAAKMKNRVTIELKNPGLPPKTPVDNPAMWLDVSKIE